MIDHIELENIELLCIIVNVGVGNKVLQSAKEQGVTGGTIFLGKGTVNNSLLKFLALDDIRKEIVLLIVNKSVEAKLMQALNKEFKFEKPNHGIAFTTSIMSVVGASSYSKEKVVEIKDGETYMYHSITVIVDKGKAELVVDAAQAAGSRGGTIINARGAGIHETSKLFSMEIVPEKEMVLILSQADQTDTITDAIRKALNMDEPGNGLIYVQEVNKTYGLYKTDKSDKTQ